MSQVVIITGASSGIGRAAAVEFVKKGARVVLASRHADAAKSLMDELNDARVDNRNVSEREVTT